MRLLKIWTTRAISSSRPITGSSLPSLASCVRSLLYWFKVGVADLPRPRPFAPPISFLRTFWSTPHAANRSIYNFCRLTPSVFKSRTAIQSESLISAIKICSVPICSDFNRMLSFALASSILRTRGVKLSFSIILIPPSGAISCFTISTSFSSSTSCSSSTLPATPFAFVRPIRRCSVPI